MFIVWAYLFTTYWDIFGFRSVVEIVLRYMVPAVIGPRWAKERLRPEQKASTYGETAPPTGVEAVGVRNLSRAVAAYHGTDQ